MIFLEDIIAAIATPIGEGGIGIIRVTGEGSIELVDKVFKNPKGKILKCTDPNSIVYGHIYDDLGQVIDEVLVSVFKGPRSFTAEDTVEINCHGGIIPIQKVLQQVLSVGARLAEPGEFAKRAFLNGRLDLAQAESIIDVIRSQTDMALKIAVKQLQGGLSQELKIIRDELLEVIAYLEAHIDFPEEDLEDLSSEANTKAIKSNIVRLKKLIENADTGKIFREGLRAVIVGKPNVGKSSLLNALLREKRAIVTDIPGTTRDVIEEILNIKGIPIRLIDTAGIRETEDLVEKIGVEKSKELFQEADLVLMVLDASTGFKKEDEEIFSLLSPKQQVIIIVNKTDLVKEEASVLSDKYSDYPVLYLSVKENKGIDKLEEFIANLVLKGSLKPNELPLVTNQRHREVLIRALKHLDGALGSLDNGLPEDFISIDIRGAWETLGEITGDTVGEDLLDLIFSRFCLGK